MTLHESGKTELKKFQNEMSLKSTEENWFKCVADADELNWTKKKICALKIKYSRQHIYFCAWKTRAFVHLALEKLTESSSTVCRFGLVDFVVRHIQQYTTTVSGYSTLKITLMTTTTTTFNDGDYHCNVMLWLLSIWMRMCGCEPIRVSVMCECGYMLRINPAYKHRKIDSCSMI